MALPDSPSHFTNGYEEDPIFAKSHYTQDISEQMRVPKRIRATGEIYDDFDHMNGWNHYDKIDMTVPDRIMIIGQDEHMGEWIFMFFVVVIHLCMAEWPNWRYVCSRVAKECKGTGVFVHTRACLR